MFGRIFSRGRRLRRRRRHDADLHCCPDCAAESVYPVYWESFGETHWWMALRCGACAGWAEVLVDNATAQRFDKELDRAQDEIVDAADRLAIEIMSAEADAFAADLNRGLICADDFAD